MRLSLVVLGFYYFGFQIYVFYMVHYYGCYLNVLRGWTSLLVSIVCYLLKQLVIRFLLKCISDNVIKY